jgi:PAS domain S-box-containing protein
MKLVRRFSLILAASLVGLAVLLAVTVERTYDSRILREIVRDMGVHVREESSAFLGSYDPRARGASARFALFLERVRQISTLAPVRSVAILSPSGDVLFADAPSLVGRIFPHDPDFRRAMEGKITVELTGPSRESLLGVEAGDVVELYVPLAGEGGAAPRGVALLYLDPSGIHRGVAAVRTDLWIVLALGLSALYVALVGVVRKGDLLLREQQDALDRSRKELEARRLDLLDRIGAFALEGGGAEAVLAKSSRDVCDLLSVDCCTIRLYGDPDRVGSHSLLEPSLCIGDGGGRPSWGQAVSVSGRPLVVDDGADWFSRNVPGEERGAIVPGSFVAVPLSDGKAVQGLLAVGRKGRHEWSPEEVHVLEAVAGQVEVALRQALLLQAQRDMARRLLSLMNNLPGAPYQGKPDWTVSFIGADILAITGYTAEEIVEGRIRWRDLIHPEDAPEVRRKYREAVAARKERVRAEYRLVRKDGAVVWVADRRFLSYDGEGRFDHVDGLVLDITERKASDERLRLTQFTVDHYPDGACWLDGEGRLLYVNDALCALVGYDREELLSMRIADISPMLSGEGWKESWANLREKGIVTVPSTYRKKDGALVPVEVTAGFLEFGLREYCCAAVRDVRERQQAEDEAKLLQAQLLQAQKMEALGLLAGGVAHDFNNLLQGILGYASLLREKAMTMEEVARAAEVIQESADRASRLTGQLLGFARKGKNRVVPLDLNGLVLGVTSILERTLNPKIAIHHDLSGEPVGTMGDPSQVEQVIMNLVVNACDAMPQGGDLRIRTAEAELGEEFCRLHPGSRPGRHSVVAVSDTGTGIPKEHLERIFDPFFTTKEQGKGTGLGLSMVFGIVKNHGGYIDVTSREGEGTAFTVYFPWTRPPRPVVADEATLFRRGGRKRGTVLVVDDQDAVREVCASMLAGAGYEVVLAPGGAEGVEIFRERRKGIDLVILDMIMPGMTGRECFRLLKGIDPAVRAVLSTGYSLEGEVQETMDEGILAFIQKPYRMGQLVEIVDRLLAEGGAKGGGG